MKVQDCMTSPARSCTASASLVTAAEIMWESKIGALPVLDPEGHPIGMITDRDICMAAARKGRFAGEISVRETMSPNPFTARPDDDLAKALDTMAARQVRRLPVVEDHERSARRDRVDQRRRGGRRVRRTGFSGAAGGLWAHRRDAPQDRATFGVTGRDLRRESARPGRGSPLFVSGASRSPGRHPRQRGKL